MSWNNGLERKIFEAKWKKTEKEYIAAGMSSEAIEAMRSFDWDFFKLRRNAAIHEQKLVGSSFDDDSDDTQSALLDKFLDVMSTSDEVSGNHSRYWWIEELENTKLVMKLRSLSDECLDLITLVYLEGYTQPEVAVKLGIPLRTVERRLASIRKNIL